MKPFRWETDLVLVFIFQRVESRPEKQRAREIKSIKKNLLSFSENEFRSSLSFQMATEIFFFIDRREKTFWNKVAAIYRDVRRRSTFGKLFRQIFRRKNSKISRWNFGSIRWAVNRFDFLENFLSKVEEKLWANGHDENRCGIAASRRVSLKFARKSFGEENFRPRRRANRSVRRRVERRKFSDDQRKPKDFSLKFDDNRCSLRARCHESNRWIIDCSRRTNVSRRIEDFLSNSTSENSSTENIEKSPKIRFDAAVFLSIWIFEEKLVESVNDLSLFLQNQRRSAEEFEFTGWKSSSNSFDQIESEKLDFGLVFFDQRQGKVTKRVESFRSENRSTIRHDEKQNVKNERIFLDRRFSEKFVERIENLQTNRSILDRQRKKLVEIFQRKNLKNLFEQNLSFFAILNEIRRQNVDFSRSSSGFVVDRRFQTFEIDFDGKMFDEEKKSRKKIFLFDSKFVENRRVDRFHRIDRFVVKTIFLEEIRHFFSLCRSEKEKKVSNRKKKFFLQIFSSVEIGKSSFKLSEESKVWLAEAEKKNEFEQASTFFVVRRETLPTMKFPVTSPVDDRLESFDAPASELTEELNEGIVRAGRRGRTLINWTKQNRIFFSKPTENRRTSSRSSIGVFCGDEVFVGLKIVLFELFDEVRLPERRKFS